MLSHFADVYYNGVPIQRGGQAFGFGETLALPQDHYDLYYVRANDVLFAKLPHPKICMAYPYNQEIFNMADGLVVTTDIWKRMLLNPSVQSNFPDFFSKWYPDDFETRKPIIQFKQAIDPSFAACAATDQRRNPWKFKLTNTDVFGFYGRLDKSSLPYAVMKAADADRRILLAFAGRIRNDLKSEQNVFSRHIYLGEVPYEEMPQLVRATACSLAGESCDDDVLGSNKVLDSICLGVPVICKRNPVRNEYLGPEYAGLFDSQDHAAELLGLFVSDRTYRRKVIEQTAAAAHRNAMTDAAAFTCDQIDAFLAQYGVRAKLSEGSSSRP